MRVCVCVSNRLPARCVCACVLFVRLSFFCVWRAADGVSVAWSLVCLFVSTLGLMYNSAGLKRTYVLN